MNYLFVYGTLMLKYPQNNFVKILKEHCTEVIEGYTLGNLYLKSTYPTLVEGKEKVFGEILLLDNITKLFPVLDEYEGYYENNISTSYYLRKQILCKDLNENELSCWAYIYNRPVNALKPIKSGRFY